MYYNDVLQVEYKRGHEERVTQFTSVTDTPEILHAKTGVSLASDVRIHFTPNHFIIICEFTNHVSCVLFIYR